MPTGSKRTLRSLSWRPLATGLILVVLLAGGMLAEAAVSRAGGTTTSTSVGSTSTPSGITSTRSTRPAKASGSHGSTGLYVGVVVVFVLFIGALYGTDLVWENRRQDKVLEYVKAHRDDLTQAQRAQLLDKLTDGTDGLVRALIALGAIGVFAAALFYFLIRNPHISNKTIVENAMTALVTLLTAITAFYFGTRAAQKTGDGGQDATKKT
jgi:hypothetical protein